MSEMQQRRTSESETMIQNCDLQKRLDDVWKAASHTSGCFFQTPTWAEIIVQAFPRWKVATEIVNCPTGNVAVVPAICKRVLPGVAPYVESMVPGVYGGPVFIDSPESEDWHAVWEAVEHWTSVTMCGNPFSLAVDFPTPYRVEVTHAICLRPGFAKVRAQFSRGHKANINYAKRMGVEVAIASKKEQIDAYDTVYRDALRTWGQRATGFYPKRLFEALFSHPEYGRSIKLWFATVHGEVVAGDWIFSHNGHTVAWNGARHSGFVDYKPTHLIFASAIADACESGAEWFDFNPSGGMAGVAQFKEGFGTQCLPFPVFRRLSWPARGYRLCRWLRQRYLRVCPL
jgi:hypothetical protein